MTKEAIEYIGAMRLLIQYSWRDRFTNPNGGECLCSGQRHGQRRSKLAIVRTTSMRLGDRIKMMLMLMLVLHDGISGQYLRLMTVVDFLRFAARQPPALSGGWRRSGSLVYAQTFWDMCWLLRRTRHRGYSSLVRFSGTSVISSDLALGKHEETRRVH